MAMEMRIEEELRVLLVEDSEDDVFFFERALGRTSVSTQLTALTNGAAAMDYLADAAERKPHVVFLDLKLPQVSGFEVLRWLRTREFDPPLRVVVLSGSDQDRDLIEVRELGAYDYIVKPIGVDRLRQVLRDCGPPG
jgi:two-component system response regulator